MYGGWIDMWMDRVGRLYTQICRSIHRYTGAILRNMEVVSGIPYCPTGRGIGEDGRAY